MSISWLPIPVFKCSHLILCCRLSTSDYFSQLETWLADSQFKKLFSRVAVLLFCVYKSRNFSICFYFFIWSEQQAQRKKTVCARFMALFDECMGTTFSRPMTIRTAKTLKSKDTTTNNWSSTTVQAFDNKAKENWSLMSRDSY